MMPFLESKHWCTLCIFDVVAWIGSLHSSLFTITMLWNAKFPEKSDPGRISEFIPESHGVPLTFISSFSKVIVGKIHILSEFFQIQLFQNLFSCITSTRLSTNSTFVWEITTNGVNALWGTINDQKKILSPIFIQGTEMAIFTKLLWMFILTPQRSVDPTFCFAWGLIKSSFEIITGKRSVLVGFLGSFQCF